MEGKKSKLSETLKSALEYPEIKLKNHKIYENLRNKFWDNLNGKQWNEDEWNEFMIENSWQFQKGRD